MNFLIILILLIFPIEAKFVSVCKQSQINLNNQLLISAQLVCPENVLQLSTEELCNYNECIDYIKQNLDQIPICFHDKHNLHEDAENILKKCNPTISIPNSINTLFFINYTLYIIIFIIYSFYF